MKKARFQIQARFVSAGDLMAAITFFEQVSIYRVG